MENCTSDLNFGKVDLVAGTSYLFNLTSDTLDTNFLRLFDSRGHFEESDFQSRGETSAAIGYTPTVSGSYYLSASDLCDNLSMRVDTEEKLEKKLGIKDVREPMQSYYNGTQRAIKNEHNGLCRDIWEKYGCYGSEIPRLIQESLFRVKNPVLCEF